MVYDLKLLFVVYNSYMLYIIKYVCLGIIRVYDNSCW